MPKDTAFAAPTATLDAADLRKATTRSFTLFASSPSNPVVVRSDDPDAMWVIMPMRLEP